MVPTVPIATVPIWSFVFGPCHRLVGLTITIVSPSLNDGGGSPLTVVVVAVLVDAVVATLVDAVEPTVVVADVVVPVVVVVERLPSASSISL